MLTAMMLGTAATNVRADSVVSWGYNNHGQLGDGSRNQHVDPAAVNGLSAGVTSIATGSRHSLAIVNGGLYTWGFNYNGELGNANRTDSYVPIGISGYSTGVTAIAGGMGHSLMIWNGGLYGFGSNGSGELGNGSTTDSAAPVGVSGMSSGVTAIAGGGYSSLAVKNGAAYAWGTNGFGQLGNGTTASSTSPIAIGNLSGGVTAISAGNLHSLAVRNGALYTWGSGTLTPMPVNELSSGVTAIAAGDFGGSFNLAVQNGSVFAWGVNDHGQLGDGSTVNHATPERIDPTHLSRITAVAVGTDSSYALSGDGSVWSWGDNSVGELGLATPDTRATTPQHLLPPSGYAYTSISSAEMGIHVLATLATCASLGDISGDNKVDIVDLGILASHWQFKGAAVPGDINGDGSVDVVDLGILAGHWQLGVSGSTTPSFTAAMERVNVSTLPEPNVAGLLIVALTGIRRWRL